MAIYTGVADANGDFNIPFSANYTSGQKVTVTAEKDGATKSIELFAPSDTLGGGAIQFSGTLANFPNNIGHVTITGLSGAIGNTAFYSSFSDEWCGKATGLTVDHGVTSIGSSAFSGWSGALSLLLPEGLLTISQYAFDGWSKCKTVTLPSSITSIADGAFRGLSVCESITIYATTPPLITSITFINLRSACIFKVPAASVAAYQAAPNWSAFAARIQAI